MMDVEKMLAILFRVPYLRGRIQAEHYPFKAQLLEQWQQFSQRFASADACYHFLFQQKWPAGFRCPQCNSPNASKILTRKMPLYQCQDCYHQTTLTARTVMDRSRIPLQKWLMAFFFLTRKQLGVNAFQLHLLLEVTYKTAWSIHKKIRLMISESNDQRPLGSFSMPLSDNATSICDKLAPAVTVATPATTTATTPAAARSSAQPVTSHMINVASSQLHGIMFERAFNMRPVLLGFSLHTHPAPAQTINNPSPIVANIRLKIIPQTQMISSNTVCSSYIASFKHQSFCKQLLPTQIIPAQTMVYRPKRAVQNAFDTMMQRLYQTYGFIREKYLQYYYDELCFYHTASAQSISMFGKLAQLSMAFY